MAAITVSNLTKSFPAAESRAGGFFARLWPARHTHEVMVVRDLSFSIAAGERVAFIGPNGAGKSTTLKMLTGILEPTSGIAEVAGFVPWRQRRQLAYEIGIVFGQRSQLWHQLRVRQSFDLLGKLYGVDAATYALRLAAPGRAVRHRRASGTAGGRAVARPAAALRDRRRAAARALAAAARRADDRPRRHRQGGDCAITSTPCRARTARPCC